MFVHAQSDGTSWIKPVLCLTEHLEISMTDEQCKSFPWNAMCWNIRSASGRHIFLHSGTYGAGLQQLNTWTKTQFSMDTSEEHLVIRMQLERTPEELAVAMGKHPRLGQESLFSTFEPEILQLICDLAYD